jgi:hypothetical protein
LKILEFYFVFRPQHHADDLFHQNNRFTIFGPKDLLKTLKFPCKIVILMKNSHQHDAQEEIENKIQEFSKNFIRTWVI